MEYQHRITLILDHYTNPRHRGMLNPADITLSGGIPGCGDLVTVYLNVDSVAGCITQMTFEGEGCTLSQAAASILIEQMQGASLQTVATFDPDALLDMIGRDITDARPHCAMLAINVLKRAVKKYQSTHRELPKDLQG